MKHSGVRSQNEIVSNIIYREKDKQKIEVQIIVSTRHSMRITQEEIVFLNFEIGFIIFNFSFFVICYIYSYSDFWLLNSFLFTNQ